MGSDHFFISGMSLHSVHSNEKEAEMLPAPMLLQAENMDVQVREIEASHLEKLARLTSLVRSVEQTTSLFVLRTSFLLDFPLGWLQVGHKHLNLL